MSRFTIGVALLRRRDHRGVDDLAAHWQKPGGQQRRVKAAEENLDCRFTRAALFALRILDQKPAFGDGKCGFDPAQGPSHGGNTGSNPIWDAKDIRRLGAGSVREPRHSPQILHKPYAVGR